MIIITGATGQLGSRIVRQLLERVPAEQIGVSVRDPERAADLALRGVRVRRGDFADPDSLAEAFEGATQLLVVSSNSAGEAAVEQHVAAIEAARAAGAERVLYTSHQASGPDSLFAPMRDHAATEAYLSGSGLPFTSLRNGFYASTVPFLLGPALQTGELVAPADGPVSWTTHADLAAATAKILGGPGPIDGISPPLTAPATYDLEDVAGILSELTGRSIRRVLTEDEAWAEGLVGHGVPEQQAQMMLGLFLASRSGEFAVTDPTLEVLLERPAQPLRSVLEGVVAGS